MGLLSAGSGFSPVFASRGLMHKESSDAQNGQWFGNPTTSETYRLYLCMGGVMTMGMYDVSVPVVHLCKETVLVDWSMMLSACRVHCISHHSVMHVLISLSAYCCLKTAYLLFPAGIVPDLSKNQAVQRAGFNWYLGKS